MPKKPNHVRRNLRSVLFEKVLSSGTDPTVLSTAYFWTVVSGILMRLPFPGFELGWVSWLAMAPFLYHLFGKSAKEAWWLGMTFGTVFFYLNLVWLNELTVFNPVAPLGIFFLALYCALVPALFAALSARVLTRRSWVRFLFVPALWTALEFARSWSELAFPWIYLGHSQVQCSTLIQICDLTGVAGLSFLILLSNLVLAYSYRVVFRRRDQRDPWLMRLWATLLIALLGTVFYGKWRLSQGEEGKEGEDTFRVAVLQPGVPQARKLASYLIYDQASLRQARSIQEKMNQDIGNQLKRIRSKIEASGAPLPDLYILPESVVTSPYFNIRESLRTMVELWSIQAGGPILLGANRFEAPAGVAEGEAGFYEKSKMFNSAYLVDPETGLDLEQVYDKMHLVPFGEYSSYFGFIPGFTEYVLGISDFTPGEGPVAFDLGGKRFGVLICFESCFPYLFRKYEELDVDWTVILTNDAWYGLSSGARRHQTLSIFRAVETRRSVVRVANTGISCVIDPWGRETARLELREDAEQEVVAAVPLRPERYRGMRTFYMVWGEWFAWLCFLYCGGVLIWVRMKRPNAT